MPQRDFIAIGGSLGAVEAMTSIFKALPADLGAGLAITIHVGAQGNNLLAGILDERSALRVKTAEDGEAWLRGWAYVAPADNHLLVMGDVLRLGRGPRENMSRPAIDPLFRSVGLSLGPRSIGVVLTGMLNDGAAGLADLKRCGGITAVQNPADAKSSDMPLGALRSANVDYRAPLSDLPDLLVKLAAEEAGPPQDCPPDVRLEVEIALGSASTPAAISAIADPVALTCPDCGGVLSQIRRAPLRFRCQVGHSYTADALAAKAPAVDDAIRVALRIIEERILLSQKIAGEARRAGRYAAARTSADRVRQWEQEADVLREVLAGGG